MIENFLECIWPKLCKTLKKNEDKACYWEQQWQDLDLYCVKFYHHDNDDLYFNTLTIDLHMGRKQ